MGKSLTTTDAFLKEIRRHKEASEYGDTICLSRSEADSIWEELKDSLPRDADTDELYADNINSGDYLYGVLIEIPDEDAWKRWGEPQQI